MGVEDVWTVLLCMIKLNGFRFQVWKALMVVRSNMSGDLQKSGAQHLRLFIVAFGTIHAFLTAFTRPQNVE